MLFRSRQGSVESTQIALRSTGGFLENPVSETSSSRLPLSGQYRRAPQYSVRIIRQARKRCRDLPVDESAAVPGGHGNQGWTVEFLEDRLEERMVTASHLDTIFVIYLVHPLHVNVPHSGEGRTVQRSQLS